MIFKNSISERKKHLSNIGIVLFLISTTFGKRRATRGGTREPIEVESDKILVVPEQPSAHLQRPGV